MDSVRHSNTNVDLGKPSNWDDAKDGTCVSLPAVFETVNGLPLFKSYWKPNEFELKILNEGGHVCLGIYSSVHPPVMLYATNEISQG